MAVMRWRTLIERSGAGAGVRGSGSTSAGSGQIGRLELLERRQVERGAALLLHQHWLEVVVVVFVVAGVAHRGALLGLELQVLEQIEHGVAELVSELVAGGEIGHRCPRPQHPEIAARVQRLLSPGRHRSLASAGADPCVEQRFDLRRGGWWELQGCDQPGDVLVHSLPCRGERIPGGMPSAGTSPSETRGSAVSKSREKRRADKLAKKKKSREKARKTRGSRAATGGPASTDRGTNWPVGDCFASGNWYERGARVDVAFSRRHADARVIAAFLVLDLATGQVEQAEVLGGLNGRHLHG